MTPTDKAYAERRMTPSEPEPIPDDTLFVWLTGITAVASVLLTAAWIVTLL